MGAIAPTTLAATLILQLEDVLQAAIESVRPEMRPAHGINQLPGDPHPIARFADAAFQHEIVREVGDHMPSKPQHQRIVGRICERRTSERHRLVALSASQMVQLLATAKLTQYAACAFANAKRGSIAIAKRRSRCASRFSGSVNRYCRCSARK